MTATLVNLADRGRPSLMDVAGSLRRLAMMVETGEIEADAVAVVLGNGDSPPSVHAFGASDDRIRTAGLLACGLQRIEG